MTAPERGRFTLNIMFELFAEIYGWFTASDLWRSSCARLGAHLPAGEALRIVDLGCGPGVSSFELARLHPAARVMGVDLYRRMLAQARFRDPRHEGTRPITWLQADSARLPLGDSSVDALTGHSFLYLLADRQGTLAECLRVLRPGGRIVLMEPSAEPAGIAQAFVSSGGLRHLVSISLWRPFSRVHGRYTPESLAAELTAAGFVNYGFESVINGLGILGWAEKP